MKINWFNALLLGHAIYWSMQYFSGVVNVIISVSITKKSAGSGLFRAIMFIVAWMLVVAFWNAV